MGSLSNAAFFAQRQPARAPVPSEFEHFYRRHLRHSPGRRVRTADLVQRYRAWAIKAGASPMGFKSILGAMLKIGHGHQKSSVMYFIDVQFAEDAAGIADNYPTEAIASRARSLGLLEHIDRVVGELIELRVRVAS